MAGRTFTQAQHATYWQNTSAATLWHGFAAALITRDGLDLPHAARVLALLAVAQADAQIACVERVTADGERSRTAVRHFLAGLPVERCGRPLPFS